MTQYYVTKVTDAVKMPHGWNITDCKLICKVDVESCGQCDQTRIQILKPLASLNMISPYDVWRGINVDQVRDGTYWITDRDLKPLFQLDRQTA